MSPNIRLKLIYLSKVVIFYVAVFSLCCDEIVYQRDPEGVPVVEFSGLATTHQQGLSLEFSPWGGQDIN